MNHLPDLHGRWRTHPLQRRRHRLDHRRHILSSSHGTRCRAPLLGFIEKKKRAVNVASMYGWNCGWDVSLALLLLPVPHDCAFSRYDQHMHTATNLLLIVRARLISIHPASNGSSGATHSHSPTLLPLSSATCNTLVSKAFSKLLQSVQPESPLSSFASTNACSR